MDFSIVHYYGIQKSKCGYCKGKECSIAHGMHAYNMSTLDYQDLIDRGWRRSGHYCYKPDNKQMCCPCYTIRCNALDFKLSKSHKKVLKRMNRFLSDGKKDKGEEANANAATNEEASTSNNGSGGGIRDEPQAPEVPIVDINLSAVAAANPIRHKAAAKGQEHFINKGEQKSTEVPQSGDIASSGTRAAAKKSFDGQPAVVKKAKQMRLERRQAKMATKGIVEENASSSPASASKANVQQEKSLAEYFAESNSPDSKHKLKLKLVHVKSKEFGATLNKSYALYEKYQTGIHNDQPDSVKDYLDFLQRSPLKHTKSQEGLTSGYGSFHQQYWLDDILIAVGVIDILPYCVSSVYFFYDPDYSFLSLGTYGSLREIELVQQLAEKVPALKYYYMGFYIHSCPKMRYKGKLSSSYLLCPESYTWNLLTDETRSALNAHKYQRLSGDANAKDSNEFLQSHLDLVLLLVDQNRCITYREYIHITGDNDDRDTILEYGQLVGKPCAHRMLYLKT